MKSFGRFMRAGGTLILTALWLAGCGSTPSVQFYTLSSLRGTLPAPSDSVLREEAAVGVGPVEFPQLLNKPQIVTRTGSHKVHADEFHRWGSPLREDFTRILAENLAALLNTPRVVVFPWGGYFHPAYRVMINVQRFDGQWGGHVTLDATWTVLGRDDKELAMRRSVVEEQVSEASYEALVSAESLALAALSREIAEQIRILDSGGGNR